MNLIDLHCHVIWGIDDGARDFEETMAICHKYIKNGFNRVVATPHHIKGTKFCVDAATVIERAKELNELLKEQGMDLQILPGMEIMLDSDSIVELKNKNLLTLNSSRYVLVESPAADFPKYALDFLFQLQGEGYIPILAHPERNKRIMKEPKFARELFDRGILFQINKGSISGLHGKVVQKFANSMLRSGLAHLIATDTHRHKGRSPSLQNLQSILKKLIGEENTNTLMVTNPTAIFEDRAVIEMKPIRKSFPTWAKVLSGVAVFAAVASASAFYAFNRVADYTLEKMFENDLALNMQIKTEQRNEQKTENVVTVFNNNNSNNSENVKLQNPPITQESAITISDYRAEEFIFNPREEISNIGESWALDNAVTQPLNKAIPLKREGRKYEEIQAVKTSENKFTSKDRARVMEIIYGSVPGSEINRLQALEKDGLTSSEISQIKSIIKGYLSGDQINELKVLYSKYVRDKNK